MPPDPVEFTELVGALNDWLKPASCLWTQYQKLGPNRVEAELFAPVESAAARIESLGRELGNRLLNRPMQVDLTTVLGTIQETTELARRCALTPQGLCFISGEAGLLPRRDQLQAFEQGLACIANVIAVSGTDL